MLRQRKPSASTPTASKLDSWDSHQVFEVLESSIGSAGQFIHGYRTIPDMREAYLELLVTELEQALLATQSLRRRL